MMMSYILFTSVDHMYSAQLTQAILDPLNTSKAQFYIWNTEFASSVYDNHHRHHPGDFRNESTAIFLLRWGFHCGRRDLFRPGSKV